jgi:hypothetical protein
MVADRYALLNHALRPDIDARAYSDGRLFDRRNTATDAPRHSVVRVNLCPRADVAMVTDREAALPVEDYVGADPAMLPHFDVAEYQDVVVARCAFAKSIVAGDFPTVGQQIADRNVTMEIFAHLAAQIANERSDASKVQFFSFCCRVRGWSRA